MKYYTLLALFGAVAVAKTKEEKDAERLEKETKLRN